MVGRVLEHLWREQASSPERMSGCSPKVQQATYLGLKRQAGQEPGSVGASETGMVWFFSNHAAGCGSGTLTPTARLSLGFT